MHLSSTALLLERAVRTLHSGGTVVFPTETVYGLGANAEDAQAVARIFELKRRPRFNPLIVHARDLDHARQTVGSFPKLALQLANAFWPGPLTLVLPKGPRISDLVTAGLPTVAVRVPRHPIAQALLRASGLCLAAPSANLFMTLSPTRIEDLAPEIRQGAGAILDGGRCEVGVESTIIGFEGEQAILLRPGGLPAEEIEAISGPLGRMSELAITQSRPLAPGMLERHYSPRTPLWFGKNWDGSLPPEKVGRLCFTPPEDRIGFAAVEILSPRGDLREAAANLFSALRRLDLLGLELIVADRLPEKGLGVAINDRLRRGSR